MMQFDGRGPVGHEDPDPTERLETADPVVTIDRIGILS